MPHYDIVALGAGSGHMAVDLFAASKRVAVVEADRYGGTCLNRGCIPTKMFIHAAEVAQNVRAAADFGIDATLDTVRWSDIQTRVFSRLDGNSERGWQGSLSRGVDTIAGWARFTGPGQLLVSRPDGSDLELTADTVVIATGARPASLPVVEDSGVRYDTSDTFMRRAELPRRLVILGAGVIACEFAHLAGGLGSEIVIVAPDQRLALTMGESVSTAFTDVMSERWELHLQRTATAIAEDGDDVVLTLDDGHEVRGDALLVAVGRTANTGDLGLAAAGVATTDNGLVVVDDYGRTSAAGVWALGDACASTQLKHLANHQARTIAHNLAHPEDLRPILPAAIPAAIFTDPQLAGVGLTPESAAAAGREVVVGRHNLSGTAYGWALEAEAGFCEVVAERATGVILGAQLMSPHASSLIQPLVYAVAHGQRAAELAHGQLWIHPAAAELVENALLDAATQAGQQ